MHNSTLTDSEQSITTRRGVPAAWEVQANV